MLIVAGHLRVDAADRAAYLEAVGQFTAMARSAPGCLDFAQSPDPLDPERINIFERWESEADLQSFRDQPDEDPPVVTPPIRSGDVLRFHISSGEEA